MRVTFTSRPFAAWAAWTAAMAAERRSIEAWSATAAPSISKSIRSRPYASTTFWYWAVRLGTSVQDWASSVPFSPPKEGWMSPPAARIASKSALSQPVPGS